MFVRVPLWLAAALASTLIAGPAAAVTVAALQVFDYQRADLVVAQGEMYDFTQTRATNVRAETFEGYPVGTTNPQDTAVGSFTGIGATGSGHAVQGDGTTSWVRDDSDMLYGRFNAANPGLIPDGLVGGNWLDSNDMTGMEWKIQNVGMFNVVAFFLLDVADVGARFSMNIGESSYVDIAGANGRLANGNIYLVIAQLSATVDNLTLQFLNDRTNDGFGIDGALIANVAPIPLPPAAALLLAGVAVLAGVRRRRRA